MSNFLAIATVTAALRRTLEDGLKKDHFDEATVTTVRPNGANSGIPSTGTNLYLYMVTPNAALRNSDMPNYNSEGRLIQRPQVALDLHYLLTFYGDEKELKPQRLLGNAMRTLDTRPILTRQMIRSTIIDDVRYSTFLQTSNLAEALETVKFTPATLSIDELYKLWSVFFQTPYQLSVAYIGTVVLIESDETPQSTLPVRERSLYVMPFHQPVVEKILSAEGSNAPILAESTLLIKGKRLKGDITLVKIDGAKIKPSNISETQITAPLSLLPSSLNAGVHGLQVVHELLLGKPPTSHNGVESNVSAFVLHPSIEGITVSNLEGTGNAPRSADLSIKIKPVVGKAQRIVLFLNEASINEPASYTFIDETVRSVDTDTVKIHVSGVKPANYLVHVQVDGAQSQLITDTDENSPTFSQYIDPKVEVP
jgi:hypothetical protein